MSELFEKNFRPSIADVYENEYTNSANETKKQCFIKIRDDHYCKCSLILPGDKASLLEQYKNDTYPESLDIFIKKDFTYHIVKTMGDNKPQYFEVNGHDLRNEIDYSIIISLKDAKIEPTKFDENIVNVRHNGIGFTIPKTMIKENEYGQYIRVTHNAPKKISVSKKLDDGTYNYEAKDVTWNYVKKVYDNQKNRNHEKKHPDLDDTLNETAKRVEHTTAAKATKEPEMLK